MKEINEDTRRAVALAFKQIKGQGMIFPPLTDADVNHNRLILGEPLWHDGNVIHFNFRPRLFAG